MKEKCESGISAKENEIAVRLRELAAKKVVLEKALSFNAEQNIIMSYIPDLVDVVSIPDGTVVMVSKSYQDKMGYGEDELLGRTRLAPSTPTTWNRRFPCSIAGLKQGKAWARCAYGKRTAATSGWK